MKCSGLSRPTWTCSNSASAKRRLRDAMRLPIEAAKSGRADRRWNTTWPAAPTYRWARRHGTMWAAAKKDERSRKGDVAGVAAADAVAAVVVKSAKPHRRRG